MLKRTAILILLGCIVNGLFKFEGYEHTRIASVLGRIGLAWFFAGIIYLNTSTLRQIYFFVFILVSYWMMMVLIPVPGFGAGVLTKEGSLASYIDRILLPGRLHSIVYDPEGLLSTLPAIGTAMLGVFTATFLKKEGKFSVNRKVLMMTVAALVLIGIGLLWDMAFPINKRLWTSSFVCFVGGFSILFFVVFYVIIDVWQWQKWASPFIWIGTNSILIYMASEGVVNFAYTANFLFGGLIQYATPNWQPVFITCSITFIQLVLLCILFKKKIFLKI